MSEAEAFLEQNPQSAEGLTVDQIEEYATHHAGGLIVLLRYLDDGVFAKMHDSWGGDDEIVVHRYDPDEDEPQFSETEMVWSFTNAAEAFDFFKEL